MIGRGEEHELEIQFLHHGIGGLVAAPGLLFLEALGGFQINATEGVEFVLGQELLHLRFGFREIGVLVELGLEALDLAETLDEGGAGLVALFKAGNSPGFASSLCDSMNSSSLSGGGPAGRPGAASSS